MANQTHTHTHIQYLLTQNTYNIPQNKYTTNNYQLAPHPPPSPSRPLNNPTFWRMCLGKHHMNSSGDVPLAETCYQVDGIVRHPGFVYETDRGDISNDVALVHLARPVSMTREISPVCMPAPGAVLPAGTPCYVTGWGDEKGRGGWQRLYSRWLANIMPNARCSLILRCSTFRSSKSVQTAHTLHKRHVTLTINDAVAMFVATRYPVGRHTH